MVFVYRQPTSPIAGSTPICCTKTIYFNEAFTSTATRGTPVNPPSKSGGATYVPQATSWGQELLNQQGLGPLPQNSHATLRSPTSNHTLDVGDEPEPKKHQTQTHRPASTAHIHNTGPVSGNELSSGYKTYSTVHTVTGERVTFIRMSFADAFLATATIQLIVYSSISWCTALKRKLNFNLKNLLNNWSP